MTGKEGVQKKTVDVRYKQDLQTIRLMKSADMAEIDYFLNVGDILFNYYKTFKTPAKRNNLNRADLQQSYIAKLHLINNSSGQTALMHCKKCDVEMQIIPAIGVISCTKCGFSKPTIQTSAKPSLKDPPSEISHFAYKRINHFNEWLAQFQAKESTDIPQSVYKIILSELSKERVLSMKNVSASKIRKILKKCKYNKYYEHVPHILNNLNGTRAPIMTRETEEKLRAMFREIQGPFLRHCPKTRKNFLSYSYVLHKFVQLLGMDEYLGCFPLLKSREKLQQQDRIWKKICADVKYQYIKSI